MATDLNLHRKSTAVSLDTEEGKIRDREVHNRERTWLLCFGLDRSLSSQMGKPNTIREEYVFFKLTSLDWVLSTLQLHHPERTAVGGIASREPRRFFFGCLCGTNSFVQVIYVSLT